MPAKNPRINVVLDNPLYKNIKYLAERDGVSLSNKARELIKDAIDIQEDLYLAEIAQNREETLTDSNTLSHEEVWS